jgi:Rps23 Pro-64 3,4-dihydroxylase Tpa1-like proline 4-hydroxylase
MMTAIKNFLPASTFERLLEFLKLEAKWSFTGRSRDSDSESFWFADLSDSFIPAEIEVALKRHEIIASKVHAVYANGQSRGQSGAFHVDSKDANVKTCLIYCNNEWKEEWGGVTLFNAPTPGSHDGIFITPEPNKAVIFEGRQRHMGSSPDADYAGLRVTIAFKFS